MRFDQLTNSEKEVLKTLYKSYGIHFTREVDGNVEFKLQDDVNSIPAIFGNIKNIDFKAKSFIVSITNDFVETIRYVEKLQKEVSSKLNTSHNNI